MQDHPQIACELRPSCASERKLRNLLEPVRYLREKAIRHLRRHFAREISPYSREIVFCSPGLIGSCVLFELLSSFRGNPLRREPDQPSVCYVRKAAVDIRLQFLEPATVQLAFPLPITQRLTHHFARRSIITFVYRTSYNIRHLGGQGYCEPFDGAHASLLAYFSYLIILNKF